MCFQYFYLNNTQTHYLKGLEVYIYIYIYKNIQKLYRQKSSFNIVLCLSKYTGWGFYKFFQMNNELKLVTKPCIYQEIENIT